MIPVRYLAQAIESFLKKYDRSRSKSKVKGERQALYRSAKDDKARSDKLVKMVLEHEGVYSNDVSDPGGATYYGLSARAHPEYAVQILNQELSLSEVYEVYYRKYYKKIYRVNELNDTMCFLLLEASIHGSIETIASIQSWLNLYRSCVLKVDGIFGPKTFECTRGLDTSDYAALLDYLNRKVETDASLAAYRVMNYQKENGSPKYDYTNGFSNRLKKRYSAAKTLLA
jgi:lysozyme family protein